MTISLRGHHLLCMLTYVGRGYSDDFIRNYDGIVARLSRGETIEVVRGTDDICTALCSDAGAHCHARSVLKRDMRALKAVSAALGQTVEVGSRLAPTASLIGKLREAYAAGAMKEACFGCEWASLCAQVSKDGYEGARLCPSSVQSSVNA